MIDKNFNKYDLKDIFKMLKKNIVILILLIVIQLMAIIAYNFKVKQTYNITLKFTALDFLAYEKLFLIENKDLYIDNNNALRNDNLNILYYTPYTLFHSYVKIIEQRLPNNKDYDFSWRITGRELSAFFNFYKVSDIDKSIDKVKQFIEETNIFFKISLVDIIQRELDLLDKKKNIYNNLDINDPILMYEILINEYKLRNILNNISNSENFILLNQADVRGQKKKISVLVVISLILSIVMTIVYSIFFNNKILRK
tara:strand:+ start:252 stop:1016 length:765 start_codon:yes stop_codon:yes gene_type:complete